MARKCWYPTLYIPNSMAGTSASTTMIIVRFESVASWMCAPIFAVVLGTKRKDSKPSNTE